MAKFYITNAIPYVNAKPHIGHALEFIQSDVIARYHRILGDEVLLLCGGDENALKNVQAAEAVQTPIQEFVNLHEKEFHELSNNLHVQFDAWQKGSDPKHHAASQKLWELCQKNGDIYKKSYKGLYCIGCERFYTREELNENGECNNHPGKKIEQIEEENYFFKLSNYQDQLLNLIESDAYHIYPQFRKNEIIAFIKAGLEDFSISRSNERAKNWGVSVPGDDSQKIYVWFDALNIYQSGIGFATDEQQYNKWWPADIHVIGKDIIRFHAVYWPAILLSARLELPKKLFVHEFFTVNGQKMSKTLGNVIDPNDLIKKYGADALRYYFLAKFSPFSDSDFSEDKLKEVYNADLANGLGNLVARVAKLCEKNNIKPSNKTNPNNLRVEVQYRLQDYKFNEALSFIWSKITEADKKINETKPWELDENDAKPILENLVESIQEIAYNLQPFLPETAEKILKQFSGNIMSAPSLFPRK